MSPGPVERDGETRVRVIRGLELTKRQTAAALAVLVALFVVPDIARVSDGVQLSVVHRGLLFGLAAVGLNLLLRHTRLVSFGHAAFFGAGAYTAALLAAKLDVTSLLVLVVSGVAIATLLAGVIGFLSLRHTGLYFSLLTLAFGQLLYAIVQGQSVLGGTDGVPVRPGAARKPLILGQAFGPEVYGVLLYYITLLVVIVGVLVMWRIVNSPFGSALDAIGQDRTRAQFIGLPVQRYIWVAFVISGIYGGVGGALYAALQQHVRPEATLYFLRSGDILYMAILGGYQTLLGPLVGGVVLQILQDVGRDFTTYFEALTGIILVLLVFVFPHGVVGSLSSGSRLRRGVRAIRADPSVVSTWLSRTRSVLETAVSRSISNAKILVFGVK